MLVNMDFKDQSNFLISTSTSGLLGRFALSSTTFPCLLNKTYLGIKPQDGVYDFHDVIDATLGAFDGINITYTNVLMSLAAKNDPPMINHTIGTVIFDEDTVDDSIDLEYIFFDPKA